MCVCSSFIRNMRTLVLLLVAMAITLVSNGALSRPNDICPTADEAVFPYWSLCSDPATYDYSGGVYPIESVGSSAGYGQYLAPEWDSENSTYYVRLVDADSSPANYLFTHNSREIRSYVAVNASDIIIKNADTQRFLAWRDEGGEKFLVEADTSDDDTSQGFFKFTPDQFVRLPCPLIFQARCQAYDIVSGSDPSSGLTAYEEDGAIYFKLAADDLVPFVLRTTQTKSLKSLL